ncbi:hypothetical protein R2601_24090 [Salipiger bermudensis HTCC2601]|uniref:OmpR/PhoB-type domain-containing protein n=2 Tax=Salipiger TaxID=263377 RepID=Q0FH86_SALBH|nr:hypothetical protein R2601_24090 [Salipiger bermudensis HTCC2601]
MTEDLVRLRQCLGFRTRRMALVVLVLFLQRNGWVYSPDHVADRLAQVIGYDPTEEAVRGAVKAARQALVRAGWPVQIRAEYGIGYCVTWPRGWKVPEPGDSAAACAADISPPLPAPAGAKPS